MGDLSANFSKSEFACKCGCGTGRVAHNLIMGLQIVRDLGGVPMIVTSGIRCRKHNAAEGGHPRSRHLSVATAADVCFLGLDLLTAFELSAQVNAFQYGGIGVYPRQNFLHLELSRGRHPRPRRWGRVRGKYVGVTTALDYLKEIMVDDAKN